MTKQIRIENADTSDWKVIVEVWDKGYPEGESDKLAETLRCDYPTAMTQAGITSTRYLIVKEAPYEAKAS